MDPGHDVRKGQVDFMTDESSIEKDARDFHVDIFEKEKKVRVVAELPGVNEEDIRLDLTEDILTISASQGNQNYYKNVKLPNAYENIVGKIFNNGILEVILD